MFTYIKMQKNVKSMTNQYIDVYFMKQIIGWKSTL
jgi:hypothetical protein